ncbi:baseplate J/gp47 family protein [Paenibacillus alba]|uniref:Baseplate J/gp47 family protein n=1 Tax=Paenibacillus alba TaxID=1197127 RepID=A0ABU6GCA9_9BACL|nr:baseplate J/gp47 family protein [Paenibacillus alba]MEC0231280.1 baseplate J/gp47 family protein [Paenibacillus alba]
MFKTYDQILAELIADLKANSNITDETSGALSYTLLSVQARALRMVWFMLEQIINLFFVSSSKGSFLERRCAERGVLRKKGTSATGTVNFTRTSPAVVGTTLIKGTLLSTMDGSVNFTVNDDVTLPSGWTNIPAQVTSSSIGVSGNLVGATALQVVGAQVVGVQNVSVATGGLSGGTDTETDEALRTRYLYTIQNPQNGGTPADYVVWATEVQGVTYAISLPLNRGNGTIDVVITDGGIPSDALVSTVSDHIGTKRPVGAGYSVIKPIASPVNVTGSITADQGYTNDTLIPLVKQAIQNYLKTVPIGGVVRVTGLYKAAMSVKGVLDFTLTAPSANILLSSTWLATPGTLNVT